MNERQSPSLSSESVSQWLEQIKHGEEHAAQLLWQGYLERLLRLATRRLANSPRGAADEEDVVLSAFDSFLRAAKDGRFPRLVDREDLWQILVCSRIARRASSGDTSVRPSVVQEKSVAIRRSLEVSLTDRLDSMRRQPWNRHPNSPPKCGNSFQSCSANLTTAWHVRLLSENYQGSRTLNWPQTCRLVCGRSNASSASYADTGRENGQNEQPVGTATRWCITFVAGETDRSSLR